MDIAWPACLGWGRVGGTWWKTGEWVSLVNELLGSLIIRTLFQNPLGIINWTGSNAYLTENSYKFSAYTLINCIYSPSSDLFHITSFVTYLPFPRRHPLTNSLTSSLANSFLFPSWPIPSREIMETQNLRAHELLGYGLIAMVSGFNLLLFFQGHWLA